MINHSIIYYKILLLISILLLASLQAKQQQFVTRNKEIDFVSDTQQPLSIEKLKLPSNHNTKATSMIFADILKNNPAAVYMLGDIVGLGSSTRKWKAVDKFIDSSRKEKIVVHALLGNHDVMWTRKKGEYNFAKRFPQDDKMGYLSVEDSIAIVMLNSNFKKLSAEEIIKQSAWYKSTLLNLESDSAVLMIIVCCHHAPYTNSLIVHPSQQVRKYFVPLFLETKKCKLFITGHAHAFEHFKISTKDFLVIGGGGGLHQPLDSSVNKTDDLASTFKPIFHYLSMLREGAKLLITSHFLASDFSGFKRGYSFEIKLKE
ncbi:MAG TPA: metallophosphoesterase [Puia sp.]|jgi:UDP-2,3-diacylglucosamine pyrophosphatase LpxH|nr:metallophosphoesterase [Puia sp.]